MRRLEKTTGLGVVVPIYDEAEVLPEFHRRLTAVLRDLPMTWEIVYVNDGSQDGSADILDCIAENEPDVRVLHLSRNFGHQAAVCAGLDHVSGQAIVVMDGDLQDPPEVIPLFLERWREGFDVVYAIRTKRKEGVIKRAGYFLFYRLLHAMADLKIPLDSGDFCLLDGRVVEALRHLPERERFVRGLRSFVGFRQIGVRYERGARTQGRSKYTWRRLAGLAIDGLVNFSSLPLKLVAAVGAGISLLGFALAILLTASAVRATTPVSGWAVVLAAVVILGGGQLLALGIVGEYVRRIFVEVKGRPPYIISEARPAEPRVIRRAKAG